jgi:hypothetical protein
MTLQYGSLKIKRPVYNRFLGAQEGRETQTETLSRLLDIRDAAVRIMVNQFGQSSEYLKWKERHDSYLAPVKLRPDSQEVPDL